jgi:hypothetical protein
MPALHFGQCRRLVFMMGAISSVTPHILQGNRTRSGGLTGGSFTVLLPVSLLWAGFSPM